MSWTDPLTRVPGGDAIATALGAALQAVDPREAVRRALTADGGPSPIRPGGRLQVIAIGKAAVAMTRGAFDVLGDRISDALVVTKQAPHEDIDARVLLGAHPIPGPDSLAAAQAVVACAQSLGARDAALVLLSGGASSLVAVPDAAITLRELGAVTEGLLRAGACIDELNVVRRRLDVLKGGGLAAALASVRTRALVLSDVIDDDLATIGSGPLVASPDGRHDAMRVLQRHKVEIPQHVWAHLAAPMAPRIVPSVPHTIVANNADAVRACARSLRDAGYAPHLAEPFVGDADEVGRVWVQRLRGYSRDSTAEVAGGETTVDVTGTGHGGRNLHLALSAAIALDAGPAWTLATFATDGEDGPTDAAGAVVTASTVARAAAAGIDARRALRECNAYALFEAIGDLLRPGPTGTNVCDLAIAVHPGAVAVYPSA